MLTKLLRKKAISHISSHSGLLRSLSTFDLIFMGPPYHDERWTALSLTQPTLQEIARAHLLKEGGIVVGQHHIKEPAVDLPDWDMYREETYGDTKVSFFRRR